METKNTINEPNTLYIKCKSSSRILFFTRIRYEVLKGLRKVKRPTRIVQQVELYVSYCGLPKRNVLPLRGYAL